MLIIGLVLLIVGAVLLTVSFYETGALTNKSSTMTQVSSGKWESNPINMTTSGLLTVTTSSTSFGLVPAADVSIVTSSNLNSYALKANSSTSVGSHSAYVFEKLSGEYYIVAFSTTSPSVTTLYLSSYSDAAIFGISLLGGGAMAVIGLVLAILGAVMKNKNMGPPVDQ